VVGSFPIGMLKSFTVYIHTIFHITLSMTKSVPSCKYWNRTLTQRSDRREVKRKILLNFPEEPKQIRKRTTSLFDV